MQYFQKAECFRMHIFDKNQYQVHNTLVNLKNKKFFNLNRIEKIIINKLKKL
jgi:hypothetical protein